MKTALCVMFASILLAGCSTPPPKQLAEQEVKELNFGSVPENYEQLAKAYFEETMADAKSVQFRFGEPFKGYLEHGKVFDEQVLVAGYFLDVWLKSEIIPEQHVQLVIKDGDVLMQLSDRDLVRVRKAENGERVREEGEGEELGR